MPDPSHRRRILAIVGVVAALAAISYAQDAAQISPEYPNDNDSYTTASAISLSARAEVHGGVTCGPTSSSPMACGVAPVFGTCPDGYDLINYASARADLPATCWRHEDVERDAGTGIVHMSWAVTSGTTWTFNRLESSTAAPAQTGTLQATHREPRHAKFAAIRRHPMIYALAIGVAVGLTIAILERRGHCPGEYTTGDPPCPPPATDTVGLRRHK